MDTGIPFVISIANEKGGVGKTTIAINLAIYLKALQEDLRVTILSFDNHFSIENMFAIGSSASDNLAGDVANIFEHKVIAPYTHMGEYGVEFIASSPSLSPPNGRGGHGSDGSDGGNNEDPFLLSHIIAKSGMGGVLIIDTRPIVDYFTESALLAADLILTPVKDRSSLVNASTLVKSLAKHGQESDKLWIVPSIIDSRQKLPNGIQVGAFLAASAKERDYQVALTSISDSPKVASLSSGATSKILPILTHARGTLPFNQFKTLATFVLNKQKSTSVRSCQDSFLSSSVEGDEAKEIIRNVSIECPVCQQAVTSGSGTFYEELRSRQRGFIHQHCLMSTIGEIVDEIEDTCFMVLTSGLSDHSLDDYYLHQADSTGALVDSEPLSEPHARIGQELLTVCSRKPADELYHGLLILVRNDNPTLLASRETYRAYAPTRKLLLRQIRDEGY